VDIDIVEDWDRILAPPSPNKPKQSKTFEGKLVPETIVRSIIPESSELLTLSDLVSSELNSAQTSKNVKVLFISLVPMCVFLERE
ncbi:45313_t:CDS:2, partial [Gigaspora margarita]